MNGKYIVGIVVIIIVAIGAYMLWSHPAKTPTDTQAMQNMPAMEMTASSTMMATSTGSDTSSGSTGLSVSATVGTPVTVTYTDQGFSPSTVTITKGTAVTFVNQSSGAMWVASNPHPVHDGYDGTTREQHCASGYTGAAPFDECSTGSSFTFTFDKVGTWGYHNHANAGLGGTVVVTQ